MLEILNCESLFGILSLDDVPTYKQFMKYDSKSAEFSKMRDRFEENAVNWLEKFLEVFGMYALVEDVTIKIETIIDLLHVMGHGGKVKYYPDDKLAMLCRIIYRNLGIKLF